MSRAVARGVVAVLLLALVPVLVLGSAAAAEPSGPAVEPSGPARADGRCEILQALRPAIVGVSEGNVSSTARQARVLRALAARRRTPRQVRAALRAVATWFAEARNRALGERAIALAALRRQLVRIVSWTVVLCGSTQPASTSTTAP